MLESSPSLAPIVPTLRLLLASLGQDAQLPHLRSLSPPLLLALLSSLLDQPLISPPLTTQDARREAIEEVKLALGVLTVETHLDLSAVDPERVVNRRSGELLVLGRVVVLLAVERGWDGTFRRWNRRWYGRSEGVSQDQEDEEDFYTRDPPPRALPLPLEPDISPRTASTVDSPNASLSSTEASDSTSTSNRRAASFDSLASDRTSKPDSADGVLQMDTVTRLTAPVEWQRRVDSERLALEELMGSFS